MAPNERTSPEIPHVSIGWLHPFFEVLEEAGVSPTELLARANLPLEGAQEGAAHVPTRNVYDFVALAARESGLADLGLRAGTRLDIGPLLPDPEHTWSHPGAYRTLESFIANALESSSNVDLWVEATPEGMVEFVYVGTFGRRHPAFQAVEQFMVVVMVRLIRHAAGTTWRPSRVRLRVPSGPDASIRRVTGTERVLYHQEVTSVLFPQATLSGSKHAMPPRDSAIWRRHRRRLRQGDPDHDLAGSLRIVLGAYLRDGSPGIERAARLTGVSVRSLQRRLAEQGLTYSELLEELRHDLALHLLRDRDKAISEVSHQLGYRDPAIFTRAFRRWTGQSPSGFRQRRAS